MDIHLPGPSRTTSAANPAISRAWSCPGYNKLNHVILNAENEPRGGITGIPFPGLLDSLLKVVVLRDAKRRYSGYESAGIDRVGRHAYAFRKVSRPLPL